MTLKVLHSYTGVFYQEKEWILMPSTRLPKPQHTYHQEKISTTINLQACDKILRCLVFYQTGSALKLQQYLY